MDQVPSEQFQETMEIEVSTSSSSSLNKPDSLKYLASNAESFEGNNLLHRIVLDYSISNNPVGERCLNAVFNAICSSSVNELNDNGYSALHLAVLEENVLMVKKLLSCFGNIDVYSECYDHGNTPLHLAAQLRNVSIITEFLNRGVDLNVENRIGKTALHLAVESRNFGTVKFLVGKGAVLNAEHMDFPMLCCAARSGDLETVNFILDKCPDVNVKDKHGKTPIYYAVLENHVSVVEALLARGAYVNAMNTDHNPLHVAALHGHAESAQALLERGSQVNAIDDRGCTPLIRALKSKGSTLLNSDVFSTLLKWGADVNAQCPDGDTALHYACKMPLFQLDILTLLLEGGADVRATDFFRGCTPLHCAASANNVGAMRLLVRAGACVSSADAFGDTPLHYAAERGYARLVRALLKRRAKVDARGKGGRNPLQLAARAGSMDAVKALCDWGADPNARDDSGKTTLFYAIGPMEDSSEYSEEENEDITEREVPLS